MKKVSGLLAFLMAFFEQLHQPAAKDAIVACLELLPHVDDLNLREWAVLNAFRQFEQLVTAR